MKVQCLSSDMISNLPPNILELILSLLSIRDASRTSVLSRKWRYSWVNIPKLVFDDELFEGSTTEAWLSNKYKVLSTIYQVLLRHRGPILDFTLSLEKQVFLSDIDPIIFHLLENNTVEKFTLQVGQPELIFPYGGYTLPSSFFLLKRLTHLYLHECAFQPPSTFNGFTSLTSLYLNCVKITAEVLEHVISTCPLLKSFTLIGVDHEQLTGEQKSSFVELLGASVIEYLHMDIYPIMFFAAGRLPKKLSTSILHLEILKLSFLLFSVEEELSFALSLILSSPNLKKIKIELDLHSEGATSESCTALPELPGHVSLDHLEELEIESFANVDPELEFVKLILVKSSMLKKVVIKHLMLTVEEEVRILKDLIQLPRASSMVKFVVEHAE